MATTFKAADELVIGDRIIGADFYEQRVTAIAPAGRLSLDVTTEYVEAAAMMVQPAAHTHRIRRATRVAVNQPEN